MGIIITIKNSTCQISNQDSSVDKLLRENLVYKDRNVDFKLSEISRKINRLEGLVGNSKIKFANSQAERELKELRRNQGYWFRKLMVSLYNKGEFPTGLLPRVVKIFEDKNYTFSLNDTRKVPEKKHKFVLKESFPPLRYYQKTASRMLQEKKRGIVVFPTGTGKSVTAMRMIWDMGVNTLIITPNKNITDMMYYTAVKHFGKGKVSKLTTKSKKINKINISNIQALIKIDSKVFKDLDAVLIDEFHHSSSETYQIINKDHLKNVYWRIGLTATPYRNDGSDLALEAVLSEYLYEYKLTQAFADGYLVKPTFKVITNSVWDERNWQTTYKKALVQNEDRNKLIVNAVREQKDKQVIVLVQHTEHGEALKALMSEAEFTHGQQKDSERQRLLEDFKKKKFSVLIGTSVLGEGVDLPCAEVLVMAGGGKAKSQVVQNIGRVLRLYPEKESALIIDFKDLGSRWLSDHALERQEIYKEYETEVKYE